MKISVALTVEIDVDAYEASTGLTGAASIRADVRDAIKAMVYGSFLSEEGAITQVSVK